MILKSKNKIAIAFLIGVASLCVERSYASEAEQGTQIASVDQSVLQDFVTNMRNSYSRANKFLQDAGIEKKPLDLRGLPDGEILILNFRIKDSVRLDGDVLAEIVDNDLYLSMRDLIKVLEFPITYDAQTQNFSGWYIRENRIFELDNAAGIVRSDGVDFSFNDKVLRRDDDVYVAFRTLQAWFGLDLEPNIGDQAIALDANPPLPVMERIARRNFKKRQNNRKPPELPRGDDGYKLIDVPQADVSTFTFIRKPENSDVVRGQNVNIRTSGEFAYGALSTNISGNNEDQIVNARVTYLQESAFPEVLGPLKARRFELGDVQPTRVPITGSASPETGVRITNLDPLVRQTSPTTQISGYIFPGWDVELYRENSLLSFVETDQNGFYSFDNVRLFSDRNFFRVVAYGPQGEVREETVSVPFDRTREATSGNIYDVSLSLQNRQFYNQFESADPDRNSPHFVGFFETPLTDKTALQLGARYREENEEQKAYVSAGVSTALGETLINADFATDEKGELASDVVLTRQFGPHNFRADLGLATDEYTPGGNSNLVEVFSNRYALEGPAPLKFGSNPRYSVSANYSETSDGENFYDANLNFNTTYNRLGLNQSFLYSDASNDDEGAGLNSISSVTGSVGRNTFRGLANFEWRPSRELESLFASWRRRISPDLDSELQVGRTLDTDLTTLSAQLNYRPDYATITPRFRYDSDGNVEATLSSRFGITKNPDGVKFSRDFVTTTGSINAFVYLDANGNDQFDDGDEPVVDALVRTPQNAGGAKTNENGVAFIERLRPNIVTDVFVETGTLSDPFWIPAKASGVSIMPRTGTNVTVNLPVHNAGELDGTVYARSADWRSKPLRSVSLLLQSEDGKIEQRSVSANDGFYLFSLIPPGRYALSVADSGLPPDVRRPRPQFIEIGYDGTTIFGNDIILDAGERDVPSAILAGLDDYKAQHPHIDFSNKNFEIALNLGAYKSRLMTSFMWYRMKTRYAEILRGTSLYVPPSQSYALPQTGEHILRVGLESEDLDDAYNRCRALVARDFYCKVEIYPTAREKQVAEKYAAAVR
ncbi:MAG: hypothetical protein AB8B83_07485 [Bdellovibrionales bacterium]